MCCGLCESQYFLPLRVAPLELQFQIVSDGNEPIIVPQGDGVTQTDRNGYYFQDGNTATGGDWIITQVFVEGGLYKLRQFCGQPYNAGTFRRYFAKDGYTSIPHNHTDLQHRRRN